MNRWRVSAYSNWTRVVNSPTHLTYTMSLSALFCRARPDITSEDNHAPTEYDAEPPIYEKELLATDEEEMQQRLSDLRREINDAKVDW